MTAPRTDYARATREFDPEHENALVEAILKAVVDTISDSNCVVLRTGELTSALLSRLAGAAFHGIDLEGSA
jgi:hypothetical protein